ncbi:hypothetical protein BdWA1_000132 [Babesia duncani]|uniref:Uncharacterized protein n=1 Tax=Babesia duncani TaxID=323732 RepID=A0AAD9PLQ6_9APIC|nr:hypothetical protein BdWA1_000132 [Babesia duncani]
MQATTTIAIALATTLFSVNCQPEKKQNKVEIQSPSDPSKHLRIVSHSQEESTNCTTLSLDGTDIPKSNSEDNDTKNVNENPIVMYQIEDTNEVKSKSMDPWVLETLATTESESNKDYRETDTRDNIGQYDAEPIFEIQDKAYDTLLDAWNAIVPIYGKDAHSTVHLDEDKDKDVANGDKTQEESKEPDFKFIDMLQFARDLGDSVLVMEKAMENLARRFLHSAYPEKLVDVESNELFDDDPADEITVRKPDGCSPRKWQLIVDAINRMINFERFYQQQFRQEFWPSECKEGDNITESKPTD